MNPLNRRRASASYQVRSAAEGEGKIIQGHFSVFGAMSGPIDWYAEVILQGAFARSIQGHYRDDIKAFGSHGGPERGFYDAVKILGSTKAGTMTLKEDEVGLYGEISPPPTSEARDILALMERGELDAASIGFFYIETSWKPGKEYDILEVLEVDLMEVSVVPYGANPAASVGLRAALQDVKELGAAERKIICRALNRLEHREALEFTGDDKSALKQYRSLIFDRLSDEQKTALESELTSGSVVAPVIALADIDRQRRSLLDW